MKYIDQIKGKAVENRTEIWISMEEYNSLIKVEKVTGNVEYVSSLEIKEYSGQEIFFMHIYKHKIIMLPYNSIYIYIYDINVKKINKINIRWKDRQYSRLWKEFFVENETFIFVSCEGDHIIEFDMEEEKIKKIYSYENKVVEKSQFVPIVTQRYIYKLSSDIEKMWRFDINTRKFYKIEFTFKDTYFQGGYGQGYIWITSIDGILYQYTEDLILKEKYVVGDKGRYVLYWCKNILVLKEWWTKKIIYIPFENERLNLKTSKSLDIDMNDWNGINTGVVKIEKDNIIVFDGEKISDYKLIIPDHVEVKILDNSLGTWIESNEFNLNGYIKYVNDNSK